jgi:hypothetical protein
MNLLGKILTVLIFILSIGFMFSSFFVYATHRNWQEEAAKLESEKASVQEQNTQLTRSIDNLRKSLAAERAARTMALASLETRAQSAEQQLAEEITQRRGLQESERQAIQALAGAQSTLGNLKQEVDDLRSAVREAEADRDRMFQEVVQLKVKEQEAEGVRRRLQARNEDVVDQLSKATVVLRSAGLTVDSPLTNVPPPLEGQVVEVDNDNGLVTVSLGEDEGLKRNHTLDISRRGQYLGRIRVIRTASDRSVGKVMDGFRRGAIRVGDRVQTKVRG